MEKLKGFHFRIFWMISDGFYTSDKLHYGFLGTDEKYSIRVQESLNFLLEKGFILESKKEEYTFTEKGNEYRNNYIHELEGLIYSDKFDIAVMKFLYDNEEPVGYALLPHIITNKHGLVAENLSIDFQIKKYLQNESEHKKFFIVSENIVCLNKEGRRYYEYIANKEKEEKEKQSKEWELKMKNLELDNAEKIRNSNDYKTLKRQRNILFYVSIILLILTVISTIKAFEK